MGTPTIAVWSLSTLLDAIQTDAFVAPNLRVLDGVPYRSCFSHELCDFLALQITLPKVFVSEAVKYELRVRNVAVEIAVLIAYRPATESRKTPEMNTWGSSLGWKLDFEVKCGWARRGRTLRRR